MKGLLIALALGVAAFLLTREVVVGLLVAAAGWWFFRELRGQRTGHSVKTSYPNPPESPRRHTPRDGAGIAVVCKQVTAERQEWVSVKTGRLFDVLSPDGPSGAKPGDPGEVFVSGTRYIIRVPVGKVPSKTHLS